MVIKKGDIYWVDLPIPKGSEPGYRRPCLVVQNNSFNKSKIKTTVICVITSNLNLAKAPGNLLLQKGEGNLPKASVVNVSQMATIDKQRLSPHNKIGELPEAKYQLLAEGIKLVVG